MLNRQLCDFLTLVLLCMKGWFREFDSFDSRRNFFRYWSVIVFVDASS